MARSARPDAIIIDLKMPGMDGLTFCRPECVPRWRSATCRSSSSLARAAWTCATKPSVRASVFLNKPIDVPMLAKLIPGLRRIQPAGQQLIAKRV